MSRRSLLLYALAAFLSAGAVVGVLLAKRSPAFQAAFALTTDDEPAYVEGPVKAKWQPGEAAASKAEFSFQVEAPRTNRARTDFLVGESVQIDNARDIIISRTESSRPDFGILVNNGQTAERVLIDGFTANECAHYGIYIGGARDWWIRNTRLHLCHDAMEHGLRVADAERLRITDTVIDTELADKTSLWVLTGQDIELRNVKMIGGRNWFSIDPRNPTLPDGSVKNLIITDCWIDLDQDWANPLEFMPGSENVRITNLHVRAARPVIGVWESLEGVPAARNIRWKNIWVPAPGQPPDKPFDELEWVRLPDDAWEQIIIAKGKTREDLIKLDIGPMQDEPAQTAPAAHAGE